LKKILIKPKKRQIRGDIEKQVLTYFNAKSYLQMRDIFPGRVSQKPAACNFLL
jgi:hypothetical protein